METTPLIKSVGSSVIVDKPGKNEAQANSGAGASTASEANSRGDFNVAVSTEAKDLAQAYKKALDIAKNTPAVREDLVAKFKAQIDSGEYKPDGEKILTGMLREIIRDEVSLEMHDSRKK